MSMLNISCSIVIKSLYREREEKINAKVAEKIMYLTQKPHAVFY